MIKYKCLFCDREPFFQKSSLNAHIESEHKDKWEEFKTNKIEICQLIGDKPDKEQQKLEIPVEEDNPTTEEILKEIEEKNKKEKEEVKNTMINIQPTIIKKPVEVKIMLDKLLINCEI